MKRVVRFSRLLEALVFATISVIGGTASPQAEDTTVQAAVRDMVQSAIAQVEGISVEDLHAGLEAGQEFLILDIRTESEYEAGHLRLSRWIPRGKLEFQAAGGAIPSDSGQIVVYCKRHGRSALAAATLKQLGFSDVRYLTGGFEAWVKAGFPIYNQHGELIVREFEQSETAPPDEDR